MISVLKKIFSPTVMNRALAQFGSVSIKDFMTYTLIGFAIVAILSIFCVLRKRRLLLSDILSGVVISIYGSIMLQLTLVCRESGSRIGIELDLFHGLVGERNDFHWLMWAYMILNGLLFVPFGFSVSLFSLVNEKKTGIQFLTVTLISFMVSMMIECTQLITQRGYYEVQDLFVNTLGGIIGWMIFQIIFRLGSVITRK